MPKQPLTIWTNARLTAEAMNALTTGVAPHRLILAERVINNVEPTTPDPRLPEADVVFGQPDAPQAMASSRLRWIHLSSAGYARYDRDDFRAALAARSAVLTNSSMVYSEACAEHALSFMLAIARQLPASLVNQQGAKSWAAAAIRKQSRLLLGQSVLIIGYGQIGRRLAELLAPLQMEITAVRRTVKGNEPIRVRPVSEVNELLPLADHVMNILPAGAGNDGFFEAGRLARLKRGAIFYNIGRGATVDQAALIQSLNSGHLAAAYLDVTNPEPLPIADPLWTTPNCYITPHTAGGAVDEFDRVVSHFLGNLRRFGAGEALRDRVF
jgi:phosphoglycerate dehydrogenase-like enzyme